MDQNPTASILEHFADLEDPRVEYLVEHTLIDIISIALCAIIAGADNWTEVAQFGREKQAWLAQFLELRHGIPSHDTFGRFFAKLDPVQFQKRFLNWVQAVFQVTDGQVVPIDGKKIRRSHDLSNDRQAIWMVSAWAAENKLVLGQVKVDDKSNEITAIPELLKLLTLTGCIITIDAMGTQKEIAAQIIERGADYVLALKGNHSGLLEDVKDLFAYAAERDYADCDYHKSVTKGHGRLEIRECWTISDPDYFPFLRDVAAWVGLRTLAMVRVERRQNNKVSIETRYYLSSLAGLAKTLLRAVRTHWTIENQLHWVLDVAFDEDRCRVRQGYAAQNFAILRHCALNLLKQETSAKCGIQAKRKKAGWSTNYLLKVLAI